MTRADGRKYNELRPVEITTGFIKFAEGSVLIRCGDTVVLCNASGRNILPLKHSRARAFSSTTPASMRSSRQTHSFR